MESYIPQIALYLTVVVAMILASAYVLKRTSRVGFQNQGPMQVVATLPMGLKEKLVLVQVGDKQILIGVTPDRIVKLEAYDELVVKGEEENTTDRETGIGGDSFKSKLQQMMQVKSQTKAD